MNIKRLYIRDLRLESPAIIDMQNCYFFDIIWMKIDDKNKLILI